MVRAIARAYAATVVALRWPIVLAWIAVAAAAVIELPSLSERSSGALGINVPQDSPALDAERASVEAFGFPLFSRTILVRRDPQGLSPRELADWGLKAARISRDGTRVRDSDGETIPVAGAIPLTNVPAIAGATPERATTALAFVVFPPSVEPTDHVEGAEALARQRFRAPAEVTGVAPARLAAADIILDRLPIVELATGLLVALVVGLHFRSIGAPLATLAAVVVSYLLAVRALPWLSDRIGVTAPREVTPMIVVLLFGALTDYSIFLLSRCRERLASGDSRTAAARAAARELAGIVTVAAAIVVGASSALALADFEFFRAFGPGMAAAIAVGWLVVMTLVPALLAIFGHLLFRRSIAAGPERGVRWRRWFVGAIARIPLPAAIVVIALLVAGATGLGRLELADPVIRGLPEGAPARAGYTELAAGLGPGFAAPTLVVVRGERLAAQRPALARLQRAIEDLPGVAAVLGPADNPLPDAVDPLVSGDGSTARFALVLDDDPLGSAAIADVRDLRGDLGPLLDRAGLPGATALVGGDTALAADTIDLALGDLAIVAPVVLLVVIALLAAYLRAVAVPLLLVCASALGLAAALGVTVWLWTWLGDGTLAYTVPFAVAVLLLALGSDYGVLLVGRIWRAADDLPATDAIADAGARAARPIAAAGLVLALSFALLAIVPLQEFRVFALAMFVGLMLDAFMIRPVLVPALVALAGRRPLRRRAAARAPARSVP